MEYKSYEIKAGCGWYDTLCICPKYSKCWYFDIWRKIRGNFYFYMNTKFGMKVPLTKKQKDYLKMLDELN